MADTGLRLGYFTVTVTHSLTSSDPSLPTSSHTTSNLVPDMKGVPGGSCGSKCAAPAPQSQEWRCSCFRRLQRPVSYCRPPCSSLSPELPPALILASRWPSWSRNAEVRVTRPMMCALTSVFVVSEGGLEPVERPLDERASDILSVKMDPGEPGCTPLLRIGALQERTKVAPDNDPGTKSEPGMSDPGSLVMGG